MQIDRRNVLTGAALLGGGMSAVAPGIALAQHSHSGHSAPVPSLALMSSHCVLTGEICLEHCLQSLSTGDASLAECARLVTDLTAACTALKTLAVNKSRNLYILRSVSGQSAILANRNVASMQSIIKPARIARMPVRSAALKSAS